MKKLQNFDFIPEDAVYDEMQSPVGTLTIITSCKGLHAVLWDNIRDNAFCQKKIQQLTQSPAEKTMVDTQHQLNEYFLGKRKTFDLPLVFTGTDFQMQAWRQLLAVPYGATLTYAKQAEKMGHHHKARAVGSANGMNRIAIIVPCHRIIGTKGSLVGFAGGLEKKEFLLTLEQKK